MPPRATKPKSVLDPETGKAVDLPTASIVEVPESSTSFQPPFTSIVNEDDEEPIKPNPSTSTSTLPVSELISAMKSFGQSKADAGKLCGPEPFTSRDPCKLKAFIFQCKLYFHSSSDFDDESR